MPVATVVLLSRNYEPYVAEAIESALGQTVSDIELLIIDNGSTDGSPDVIRRYESDPRVRTFMYEENAPVTRRLNEGTAAATSEFLSFLYSDDVFLPDKLARHPDLPEGGAEKVNEFRARLLRAYAWQGARLGEDSRWVRGCVAQAVRVRPRVATSWRTVGALALSSLPAVVRSPINRAGHRIK